MKIKMKLEPKVTPKVKPKTALLFAVAGFAVLGVVGVALFFYLNLGYQKESEAKPGAYASAQDGDWVDLATWGGANVGTSLDKDVININNDHTVTRGGNITANNNTTFNIYPDGTLLIAGDLIVNNNLTLNVDGALIISGDLITNNGAEITVSGGGSVDISGSASFGNGATLVVDGDLNVEGDLTMGNNYSFSGNGTATVGNNGCGAYWDPGSGGTCTTNSILPVALLNFAVKNSDDGVVISWETSTELNNDFFEIERSENGTDFMVIGKVDGSGTTKNISKYDFLDADPLAGLLYYRLVQTDFDGTSETFRPVSVTAAADQQNDASIFIFPNPLIGNSLHLTMQNPEEGRVEIFNQNGSRVFATRLDGFDRKEEMVLPDGLDAGIYFVHLRTASVQKSFKLVKKR